MTDWTNGYITEVTYASGFNRELSPAWLATAALLLGHRAPALDRPFRYAELGCAHALGLTIFASAFPHAEFWGFDFHPGHIDSARRLAAAAGLTNIHFEEASFAELAARPDTALPAFDFVVAHGVYSWVARDAQLEVIDFMRRRLRPGGLAYLGYNTLAGLAAMLPLRALMRDIVAATNGPVEQAVPGIVGFLNTIKDGGAAYFQNNPAVVARLAAMGQLNPRYFAHEYLNRDWTLFTPNDVAADMATAKCSFIGSANLADNMDSVSLPAGIRDMIGQLAVPELREAVRDLARAQVFRRDIFRRGGEPLLPGEHAALLDSFRLIGLGRPPEPTINFTTSIGPVTGREDIYRPLLAMLDRGPLSVRDAHATPGLAASPLHDALPAIALLIDGGYAHPAVPAPSPAAARALNLAIAARNEAGETLPWLATPTIASAIAGDLTEILVIADAIAGTPGPDPDRILAAATHATRRDGRPPPDPIPARHILADRLAVVQAGMAARRATLQRLGVLSEA